MGGADIDLIHRLGDRPTFVENHQHLVRQGNVAAVGSDEVEVSAAALAGLYQTFDLQLDIRELEPPLARKPFQQLISREISAANQGK